MSFTLHIIPLAQLRELAHSEVPSTLTHDYDADALPPPFVAARGVQQIDAGESAAWCSTFYVIRNRDNRIVGACGFKHPPQDGIVEIGYAISSKSRNEGAATAAVAQLLSTAFAGGATAVLAEVNPEKIASTSVVRKLHFQNMGVRIDEDNEQLVRWLAKSAA